MILKMFEKVFKFGCSGKGKFFFKDGYLFIVYVQFSGQESSLYNASILI